MALYECYPIRQKDLDFMQKSGLNKSFRGNYSVIYLFNEFSRFYSMFMSSFVDQKNIYIMFVINITSKYISYNNLQFLLPVMIFILRLVPLMAQNGYKFF